MTIPTHKLGVEMTRKPIIKSPDILERIKGAKERLRDGHALMRIPVDPTDPDCVLADAEIEIERLRSLLARQPAAIPVGRPSTGSLAFDYARAEVDRKLGVSSNPAPSVERGERGATIQEGWILVKKERIEAIRAATNVSLEESYRGRGLYEERTLIRNSHELETAIDAIKDELREMTECDPDELAEARAASTSANVAQGAAIAIRPDQIAEIANKYALGNPRLDALLGFVNEVIIVNGAEYAKSE